MERPKTRPGRSPTLLSINWFGVVAGILMLLLALPALPWWRVNFGGGAISTAVSPFNVQVSALGASMVIPLIRFLCIGTRIAVTIGAALLIAGSLFTTRWWSKKLVSFGALKMLWLVIGIIIMGVIAGVVAPMLASKMGSGAAGAKTQLDMPTLSGEGSLTAQMDDVSLSAPITMALTSAFGLAIVAAGLGVGARIYHGRLMRKFGPPVEKKVVPKVEAKKGFISTQPALGDLEGAKKSLQAKSYDESVKNADRAIETALNGWLEQGGLKELKGKDYPAAIRGLKGLKYKVPCEKDIQKVRDLRNKVGLHYSPKKGEAKKAVKTAEKFIKKVQKIKIREKAA